MFVDWVTVESFVHVDPFKFNLCNSLSRRYLTIIALCTNDITFAQTSQLSDKQSTTYAITTSPARQIALVEQSVHTSKTKNLEMYVQELGFYLQHQCGMLLLKLFQIILQTLYFGLLRA